MQNTDNWVVNELKEATFGDQRLNKRCISLLESLSNAPNNSIPMACKNWGETNAAYRFLNNDNVTSENILDCHKKATRERVKHHKVVLIPQDTTEISFSKRDKIDGMGHLSIEKSQGFYLHPSIATTPEGLCLGIVDFQYWTREELGARLEKSNRPIEEKESYRWLKGYKAANEVALASPDTLVVSISDREGDIYEVLENTPSPKNKAFWLIRSSTNRKIAKPKRTDNIENVDKTNIEDDSLETKELLKIHDAVKATKSLYEIEFKLPKGQTYKRSRTEKRDDRECRTVKQDVRACVATLSAPTRLGKKLPDIQINVVHCVETNPPSDEDKIEWFLITSLPIDKEEDVVNIIKWYLCRWKIETFFKVLKSGCGIEKLQFESLKATLNCISMYSIISWRILYLTMLGRTCPDIDCNIVFEEDEWQSVYMVAKKEKVPDRPPKLNDIIIMIAKLGGFLGRKHDGYPGHKVMWIGLQRMRDFTLALKSYNFLNGTICV